MIVKVGDELTLTPKTHIDEEGRKIRGPLWCRVVYVHPRGRYFTVEFEVAGGTFRESYWSDYHE